MPRPLAGSMGRRTTHSGLAVLLPLSYVELQDIFIDLPILMPINGANEVSRISLQINALR